MTSDNSDTGRTFYGFSSDDEKKLDVLSGCVELSSDNDETFDGFSSLEKTSETDENPFQNELRIENSDNDSTFDGFPSGDDLDVLSGRVELSSDNDETFDGFSSLEKRSETDETPFQIELRIENSDIEATSDQTSDDESFEGFSE
jgi:hypothetical protein